jgi:hypothetical protein
MAYQLAADLFGTPGAAVSGVGLNINAFFKTRYPQGKVETMVEFGNPTLADLRKSDELDGLQTIIPMELETPQGISASLGTALDNVTAGFGAAWTVYANDLYAGLTIDAKTLMAARKDVGAFFRVKERQMNGILTSLGNVMERQLWSNGTGSLGQLSADPGVAASFTLATAADAINFHKGMTIRFYDNDGTGTGPGTVRAGGTRTVDGVNYATGVITVTAPLDAALDASDHVVRDGMLDLCIKGIPAWIPSSDPTDTFFGVARTNHPQMLGGWRQSYLGSIEETVLTLDASIRRVSQKPKVLWLSYANYNRLSLELGARAYRSAGEGAKFGTPSLVMTGPGGPVTVKAGPYVPSDAAYLLDMDTWKICTLGPAPHLVQDDGLTARVIGVGGGSTNALDGVEIRYRAFWQLVCTNPFANGRAAIS